MAQKRMSTYLVILRWKLADGTYLTRKIAENGLTSQSAKKKVMDYYTSRKSISKFGKPTFVSVIKR